MQVSEKYSLLGPDWYCTISGERIALSQMFQTSLTCKREEMAKKHSIKSIDRASILYGIHSVVFCCISFSSQVMKV